MKRHLRNRYKRVTALLIILSMLLTTVSCSCGPERPPKQDITEITSQKKEDDSSDKDSDENSVQQNTESITTDGRSLSTVPVEMPEWPYHSEALDITPIEGFHLTAEEGALYDDTVFSIRQFGEEDEARAEEISNYFEGEGETVIGAWEIDAGLGPDDHLPGEYHVEMDLAALGIPEILYPGVKVYRVSDSNQVYEYAADLDGSTLSFNSTQNSALSLTVAGIVILLGALYAKNKAQDLHYIWQTWRKYGEKDFDNKDGKYQIRWLVEEVDPDAQPKLEKIERITEQLKKEAEADYYREEVNRDKKGYVYKFFNTNRSISERVAEKLTKDENLKEALKAVELPQLILDIRDLIDQAYDYLHNEALFIPPSHRVIFRLTTGNPNNYGTAQASFFFNTYIEVDITNAELMLSGTEEAQKAKDQLLLTLTHELFHICQERYRVKFWPTDSTRFDEMVTLVLESDAKAWYKEHNIIKTDPALTNSDCWDKLSYSIDEEIGNDNIMQEQGYLLSRFIMYLREKTGKNILPWQLMGARHVYEKPNTSEPLMAAFNLSEAEFDKYFRSFCVANRRLFTNPYFENYFKKEYKGPQRVQMKKNEGSHVALRSMGNYTAALRCFVQSDRKKAMPLLLVLDPGGAENHPDCTISPLEKANQTRNGVYISSEKNWVGENGLKVVGRNGERFILEVYGNGGQKAYTDDTGYTIWELDSPEKPSLSIDEEKGRLIVALPKPKGAAAADKMDGIILKIRSSDGKNTEFTLNKEQYKNMYLEDIRISLKELTNEDLEKTTENIEFNVSYSEYIEDSKGEICCSLESDVASVGRLAPEPVEVTPEPITPEPITPEPEEITTNPEIIEETDEGIHFQMAMEVTNAWDTGNGTNLHVNENAYSDLVNVVINGDTCVIHMPAVTFIGGNNEDKYEVSAFTITCRNIYEVEDENHINYYGPEDSIVVSPVSIDKYWPHMKNGEREYTHTRYDFTQREKSGKDRFFYCTNDGDRTGKFACGVMIYVVQTTTDPDGKVSSKNADIRFNFHEP